MNRRQFLGGGAAVAGAFLKGDVLETATQDLGLGVGTGAARAEVTSRDRRVSGRFERVEGTAIALDLTALESHPPFRVVVVRRAYPSGARRGATVSDPVRFDGSGGSAVVEVEVPRNERDPGPWFYEAYARPESGDALSFLCESDPIRWRDARGIATAAGARVTEALPERADGHFARRLRENDYVLTSRWQDVDGATWTFDYRLRRSTHEAAVAADRGYVKTYEESLSNPIAADLVTRMEADARRVTAGDADATEGDTGATDGGEAASDDGTASTDDSAPMASLDAGRRFDLLVRFVQAIDYAFDAESLKAYDYHRTVEETIAAGVGDCKDRTYLLAGLLSAAFDCETAMLFQSGHVLLGVAPEDVPSLPYEYRAVEIGEDEYVPIEPSLHVPVGRYPNTPFVAVYGDGRWRYHDTGALVSGADRVLERWMEYVT